MPEYIWFIEPEAVNFTTNTQEVIYGGGIRDFFDQGAKDQLMVLGKFPHLMIHPEFVSLFDGIGKP